MSMLMVPNSLPLHHHHHHHHHHHNTRLIKSPQFKPIVTFCSSSSVSTLEEEEGALSAKTQETVISRDDPNFRGCKACGKPEIEKNCNGEGRIQGGIATVPGFGWWPIKAYRPCPDFLAAGGRYRRYGQSMDEVVSGRGKGKQSS